MAELQAPAQLSSACHFVCKPPNMHASTHATSSHALWHGVVPISYRWDIIHVQHVPIYLPQGQLCLDGPYIPLVPCQWQTSFRLPTAEYIEISDDSYVLAVLNTTMDLENNLGLDCAGLGRVVCPAPNCF